ncbi:MmcB family DNA repair protein [Methylosinus sp. Ce-a6]|uniref:MmcB family DNA repair protein n=1 Tax=Methylosinus sp. Ce-a6 TaxID=2172005 RepID=UPI00135BF1FD|nr:MmcB family DNA repair protein [Methylosinus sp. Ce-a6]
MEPAPPLESLREQNARLVTRGARRYLRAAGFSVLAELPLPGGRRADLVALGADGALRIVEVKSSLADFRADRKWMDYRLHCDRFYFAIPCELSEAAFPADAGLIVADAHGAMLAREAPVHKLASASRKAVLLRFAGAAAERLHFALHRDEF